MKNLKDWQITWNLDVAITLDILAHSWKVKKVTHATEENYIDGL